MGNWARNLTEQQFKWELRNSFFKNVLEVLNEQKVFEKTEATTAKGSCGPLSAYLFFQFIDEPKLWKMS